MRTHTILALAALTAPAFAGTEPEPVKPPAEEENWIVKPMLDIRARFEYGDEDAPGIRSATAFTVRERVGLMTAEWYGLSAFVEGEFLQAVDDSYDSGPGASTSPDDPTRTGIFDPETNELNRAWLQWKGYDTTIKGGRQRIILDNAAFVGNVGWRQNEQTYDGAMLSNTSIDDLTLFYAYANRANRIFGSDATGALRSFAGDIHLFNASYAGVENLTLTGYAYLMDFDKTSPVTAGFPLPPGSSGNGYISNNTFGGIAAYKWNDFLFRAEAAFQTDADSTPASVDDSCYTHLSTDYQIDCHTLGIGWEYLDRDFVTPLATVHAFNGFADVFIGRRIGLVSNPGLNDVYLSHKWKTPFWGIDFAQFVHLFGDNDTAFHFGWEYDTVLAKKFNDNFTAIAKFAYFDQDGPTAGPIANPADTTRVSVELNYTF